MTESKPLDTTPKNDIEMLQNLICLAETYYIFHKDRMKITVGIEGIVLTNNIETLKYAKERLATILSEWDIEKPMSMAGIVIKFFYKFDGFKVWWDNMEYESQKDLALDLNYVLRNPDIHNLKERL